MNPDEHLLSADFNADMDFTHGTLSTPAHAHDILMDGRPVEEVARSGRKIPFSQDQSRIKQETYLGFERSGGSMAGSTSTSPMPSVLPPSKSKQKTAAWTPPSAIQRPSLPHERGVAHYLKSRSMQAGVKAWPTSTQTGSSIEQFAAAAKTCSMTSLRSDSRMRTGDSTRLGARDGHNGSLNVNANTERLRESAGMPGFAQNLNDASFDLEETGWHIAQSFNYSTQYWRAPSMQNNNAETVAPADALFDNRQLSNSESESNAEHTGSQDDACLLNMLAEVSDSSSLDHSEASKRPVCDKCHATFSSRATLWRHQKLHSEERKFKCDYCAATFRRSEVLKVHMTIHTGEKPYVCFCGTTFRWPTVFNKHLKENRSGKCRDMSSTAPLQPLKAPLKDVHMVMVYRDDDKYAVDMKPSHTASSASHTDSSVDRQAGAEGDDTPLGYDDENPDDADMTASVSSGDAGPATDVWTVAAEMAAQAKKKTRRKRGDKTTPTCDQCHKTFATMKNLKRHMITHSDERPFKCHLCSAAYRRIEHLRGHAKTHTGDMPYVCQCGASYSLLNGLQYHLDMNPSGECRDVSDPDISKQDSLPAKKKDKGEHPCDKCGETFSGKKALRKHRRLHIVKKSCLPHTVGEKPYKCEKCLLSFALPSRLKKHAQRHLGQKPFACQKCTASFHTAPELRHHTYKHSEPSFKCSQCSARFRFPKSLQTHQKIHERSGEKPFKCSTCDADFWEPVHLKWHQRTHKGNRKHLCEDCGAAFADRKGLKHHIMTHTGEKPLACHICDARFSRSHHLKRHMITHSDDKPYECHLCHKQFKTTTNVEIHMKNVHSDPKLLSCNICPATFKYSTSLEYHMRKHRGELFYRCQECPYATTNSQNLRRHMHRHTGIRPYACQECGAAFSRPYHLKVHMTTHSDERPFQCDKCSKAFKIIDHLRIHAKTHEKKLRKPWTFSCRLCKLIFQDEEGLREHMNQHLAERPYQCEICARVFKTEKSLDIHKTTHTRPHVCAVCGKAFGQLRDLRNHMRKENHMCNPI